MLIIIISNFLTTNWGDVDRF